jgi:hypothetical protein
MKQNLREFKKTLPDPIEIKSIIKNTKEIHSKIVDKTSYTRDVTYKEES